MSQFRYCCWKIEMWLKILFEGDLIAICRQKTQNSRQNIRCSRPYINSGPTKYEAGLLCVHPDAVMCYNDVSFRICPRSSENPVIYSGGNICNLYLCLFSLFWPSKLIHFIEKAHTLMNLNVIHGRQNLVEYNQIFRKREGTLFLAQVSWSSSRPYDGFVRQNYQ